MSAATYPVGMWARLVITIHDDGRPGNSQAVIIIVGGRLWLS